MMNPWVLLGLGIAFLLVAASSFTAGVHVESNHRDAQLLAQERGYAAAYEARTKFLRDNADVVSAVLGKLRRGREADRQRFNVALQEAIRENKLGTCEPAGTAGVGGSGPVLTVNVGVWNRAYLKTEGGPGGNTGGVDGAPSGTSFATLGSAFTNHGENATRWRECRETLVSWQDLARRNGWVSGAATGPVQAPEGGVGATGAPTPAKKAAGEAGIGPK